MNGNISNVAQLLLSFTKKLNHTNFDDWSSTAKAKIEEMNAINLLFAEPTIVDEQLDREIFEYLWKETISDEVKEGLDLPVKNLFRLFESLEDKYVPRVDFDEFTSIHFLRSVSYKENQNIIAYTAQFAQQVQMINRNRFLLSDDLAIIMFIDSFSKVPKVKSLLLDHLENYKRNNRFISLKHMINYANLHFANIRAPIQINQQQVNQQTDQQEEQSNSSSTVDVDSYYNSFKSRFDRFNRIDSVNANNRNYSGNYDRNYSGDYDRNYSGNYDRNYSGNYDRNYSGNYDRNYSGNYDPMFGNNLDDSFCKMYASYFSSRRSFCSD